MRDFGGSKATRAKLDFTRALVAALGAAGIEPDAIAVDAEAFTLRFGKVVAQLANVFGEYERTAHGARRTRGAVNGIGAGRRVSLKAIQSKAPSRH